MAERHYQYSAKRPWARPNQPRGQIPGSAIASDATRYSTYVIAQWCSGMYCDGGDAV